MTIEFNAIKERHLDAAVALTRQIQWPHRRADWQQALRLGEGIVAAAHGVAIGTALYWRWGADYATLGLVVVEKGWQGRGIGRQLVQTALAQLADSSVRLHATDAGKKLYESLGFIARGHIAQHQCRKLAVIAALPCGPQQRLRHGNAADAPLLTELDRQTLGQHRPRLIADLFTSAECVLILEENGTVDGFACLRRFGHGFVIGPVIARHLAGAKLLVSQLLSGISGQLVRIDTDRESGLGPWLNQLGMAEVAASVTMVKGVPWQPRRDGMQAFALMSQALA